LAAPWRTTEGGIEIAVRLTPRGGAERIDGTVLDAAGRPWLAVRVTPPAEGGKANAALVRLIAKRLGVAPGAVTLVSGAGARQKRLRVAGEPAALGARAGALSEGAG
jgi:uncharacterized protein YggU (UPF0235/DUF167 family)